MSKVSEYQLHMERGATSIIPYKLRRIFKMRDPYPVIMFSQFIFLGKRTFTVRSRSFLQGTGFATWQSLRHAYLFFVYSHLLASQMELPVRGSRYMMTMITCVLSASISQEELKYPVMYVKYHSSKSTFMTADLVLKYGSDGVGQVRSRPLPL